MTHDDSDSPIDSASANEWPDEKWRRVYVAALLYAAALIAALWAFSKYFGET
jgi:hypothetical protein